MGIKFNPFKDPKQTAERVQLEIVKAEAKHGKGKGEKKRNDVAAALTDLIDIPIIPKPAERVMWNLLISLAVEVMRSGLDALVEQFKADNKPKKSKPESDDSDND